VSTPAAVPLDFGARYGHGAQRSLVLGGGGVFFIAWQTAYLAAAADAGIDLRRAERIVGTSAGSLVGCLLAAGRIAHFARLADLFSRAKALVSFLAPVGDLHPSQQRAVDLLSAATDSRPGTLQAIGHAALAAQTPSARKMRRNVGLLVEPRWPAGDRLRITAVDAYNGERLALDRHAGVRPAAAVAASSALPGVFAPQLIRDRRCMDGGVYGTGTHCDLVAGAGRAVVLSMVGDEPLPAAGFTSPIDAMQRELAALRASGTSVFVRSPSVPEGYDLMSPDSVVDGVVMGRRAARQDLAELRAFWC
jgi:NTE family protein